MVVIKTWVLMKKESERMTLTEAGVGCLDGVGRSRRGMCIVELRRVEVVGVLKDVAVRPAEAGDQGERKLAQSQSLLYLNRSRLNRTSHSSRPNDDEDVVPTTETTAEHDCLLRACGNGFFVGGGNRQTLYSRYGSPDRATSADPSLARRLDGVTMG